MNQTVFHYEEKSLSPSSHKIEGMKKGIERKRKERGRDTLKPELLFRKLQASQLAEHNQLVSKQTVTVTSCMKRTQASLTLAE